MIVINDSNNNVVGIGNYLIYFWYFNIVKRLNDDLAKSRKFTI